MGEHGVSLENMGNMENMEKMENMEMFSGSPTEMFSGSPTEIFSGSLTLFIHSIYRDRWKNHNICAWRTWSWVSSELENLKWLLQPWCLVKFILKPLMKQIYRFSIDSFFTHSLTMAKELSGHCSFLFVQQHIYNSGSFSSGSPCIWSSICPVFVCICLIFAQHLSSIFPVRNLSIIAGILQGNYLQLGGRLGIY